ncbi:hypothetical protein L9F63_022226, partial [Diploptera punctata]
VSDWQPITQVYHIIFLTLNIAIQIIGVKIFDLNVFYNSFDLNFYICTFLLVCLECCLFLNFIFAFNFWNKEAGRKLIVCLLVIKRNQQSTFSVTPPPAKRKYAKLIVCLYVS